MTRNAYDFFRMFQHVSAIRCVAWKLWPGGLTGLQLIMVEFVMTGTCARMPCGSVRWNKNLPKTQVCPQEMGWFIDGYRMSLKNSGGCR